MRASEAEKNIFVAVRAGDLEMLGALPRRRTDRGECMLNAIDKMDGRTALHLAPISPHVHIIKWLLSDKGGRALGFTRILAKDRHGLTALHLAVFYGQLACCRAIVEGCKVENGEREQMLNALTDRRQTVLHLASRRHLTIIQWLLSNEEGGGRSLGLKSETITTSSDDSKSALHKAVSEQSDECVKALLAGCTAGERIKLFVAVDELGWTVLHIAVQWYNTAAIRELLGCEEAKLIVDHRDHRGMTALHRMACDGGLDEESRNEWNFHYLPPPIQDVARALLGLDPPAAATPAAFVDVNAGLEVAK